MKALKIPRINTCELKLVNDGDTENCFYGIINKKYKKQAIKLIKDRMCNHKDFNIFYDFRIGTKCNEREFKAIDNVMIYENKNTNDYNRVISDGIGDYECVLFMSANIN